MKKLLKFGIASLSFFVLNAYIQTNDKADEQVATTNIAILESPSANLNSNNSENAVPQVDSVTETQGNGSNEAANFSTSATDENTTSTEILKNDNIISNGGQVNVEGQNATVSTDGKNVTYSYTVAYQRISSSTHGQTVNDLLIRIPKIKDATVKFTLIGTRDAKGKPINVNAPMKEIGFDDTENYDRETFNTPTSEELESGKTPYVVNTSNYEYGYMPDGKVESYGLFTNFDKSQAYKVEVTVPIDEAKKIKYLPIDARMIWKSSQEGGVQSYETGSQNLEEYSNHHLAVDLDNGDIGGMGDPSSIDESYVRNGHLIKSVSNPNTYITPNNGDWTRIPEDTNIDKSTFFNYVDKFTLRANTNVVYYVSEKEDMADQDVSALYTGNVVVDYLIKGTNQKLKETYNKISEFPIYDSTGELVTYKVGENNIERPDKIMVDGITYRLVGLSTSSDSETGTLKNGTVHITYEYEKEIITTTVEPTTTTTTTVEPTPGSSSEPGQAQTSSSEKATEAESKSVADQTELPNTGESNSQLFYTIAAILMGFFGISLLKATHDNK
ncbi:LPXTG cell wall anchor domain-containing protein [Streptococcus infantis]|jgi:R5 protein|uniref:LPXTG cell wall anchor domain-containing protein n=1 Tax=Streptococcus infantis TaxID=68892 RepID=UPI0020C85EA8|nr:LPXTG cell wall anchor domain-containing protein [Streptococcus infantis]MCP9056008.1 LPXTG cell wall anchor domain-containing protein [Streptococcus infantis]MCP9081002.1 LPXTG cell wall anchor domain-containing protein [Streptococcus infantis]